MRCKFEMYLEALVASYILFVTKYRICELGMKFGDGLR